MSNHGYSQSPFSFPMNHMTSQEPPLLDFDSPCVYDPAFGVVHLCDCRVCQNYMLHILDIREKDTSYAEAIRQRDAEVREQYLEGFRRGRDTQQQHDSERLKALQAQRDSARALASFYQTQLEESKQEISKLQDELLALQIGYNELRSSTSFGSPGSSEWLDLEGNVFPLISEPDPPSPPEPAFSSFDSSSESDGEENFLEDGWELDSYEGEEVREVGDPTVRPTEDLLGPLHTGALVTTEEPPQLSLFAIGASLSNSSDNEPPPRPVPAPVHEIFVDASGKGIGFVFEGQWQAWKLEKGWHAEQRFIQWAEAVAAELGIRLMIAAGYSGTRIRLRSDNTSVVQAISGLVVADPQMRSIIRNIRSLCSQHNITLDIKWIRGDHNPADDPSRLRPGHEDDRFPFSIDIPAHLQAFVTPTP